jgi:hypothetical protein
MMHEKGKGKSPAHGRRDDDGPTEAQGRKQLGKELLPGNFHLLRLAEPGKIQTDHTISLFRQSLIRSNLLPRTGMEPHPMKKKDRPTFFRPGDEHVQFAATKGHGLSLDILDFAHSVQPSDRY